MINQSLNSIRSKIAKFCAYRERAVKEVKDKLNSLGVEEQMARQIVEEMKKEGFVDDARFARAYAGGKFRTKKWGKHKIKRELKMRQLSDEDIQNGLMEIEGQAYLEALEQLAHQKFKSLKDKNLFQRKSKVALFLIGRGFESELVRGVLNKISE